MPGAAEPARIAAAQTLALDAVRFLASDTERLQRFLDLTGVAPDTLRSRLGDAPFLAGILDYLLGDEALLTAFADWAAIAPDSVPGARRALGGWHAAD